MVDPMPPDPGEGRKAEEQLTWLLQPQFDSPVRQENRLVQARYHLSARELKLVLYVCAMVDVNAKDFGKCRIRIEDFANLTGSDPHSLYVELRATAKEIRRKDLILENYPETDERGNLRFETKTLSWFKEVSERGEGDGYLSVVLNERLKPFLLEVKKNVNV